MNINADSVFTLGASHTVCQDYAMDDNGKQPFVTLSDGCSSSLHTDIGSRVLCHAAADVLREAADFYDPETFRHIVAGKGEMVRNLLALSQTCLDATLSTIHVSEDDFIVQMIGDGALILKHKSGKLEVVEVEYTGNYPYYLSYLLNKPRRESFLSMGTMVFYKTYFLEPEKETEYSRLPGVSVQEPFLFKRPMNEYEWALIASDGLFSFTEPNQGNPKQRRGIPFAEFIHELVNFKTFRGEFIKRRVRAFLKNKAALGWEHYDDFAVGGIYFG